MSQPGKRAMRIKAAQCSMSARSLTLRSWPSAHSRIACTSFRLVRLFFTHVFCTTCGCTPTAICLNVASEKETRHFFPEQKSPPGKMAPEVASGRGPTAAAHPPSPPPSPPQSVATIASNFRASKAFAERTALSVRVRSANAGKIPIIVEVDKRAHEEGPNTLTSLPVVKYLVSARAPGSSLREAILADAKLPTADTPLRIYLCSTGEELDYVTTLGDTDSVHRDPDGMLYVVVALFTAVPSPRTPTVPSAAVRPVATKGVVPAAIVQEVAGGSSGGVASSVSPAVGASDEPRGAKPVAYIQSLLDAPLPPQPPVGGMTNPHGELAPEGATIASCTFLNPRASGRLLPPAVPTGNGRVPASLYVATLLDVTAVGLVVPLLAAYSRHLGAGPRFTGVLQATYGLAQLIGANVFGGLSDTLGRRTLLLVSSAGGAVGYACLAAAVGPYASLPLLLASRLPIGLLKQSLTVSRALVADTTHVATRLRPMSRLGGCVAMGFVLGPGLGGVLSKKAGLTVPPMLATILFLLSNLVTFFFVPETAPLPLSMSELSALMAAAERAWREAVAEKELAAGRAIGLLMNSSGSTVTMLRPPPGLPVHGHPKPPVSVPIGPCASAATLDTPMANLVCARLIDTWRPNGRPIPPSETAPLLRRWHETLAKHAAAAKASTAAADPGVGGAVPPPPVAWATFRAALSEEYATYKVGMGMLHADASSALVLSAATAASTATPGSASASTSAAAAGGGGGGGGAFHGVLEILDSSRRLWKSKAMPQVDRRAPLLAPLLAPRFAPAACTRCLHPLLAPLLLAALLSRLPAPTRVPCAHVPRVRCAVSSLPERWSSSR